MLDDVLPGTPFTPDQPLAQVTVVGEINISSASGATGCSAGRALLWGIARNTGDLDVNDVFIEITALDANNVALGTYRTNVFNGDLVTVTGATPEESTTVAGTFLAVDQAGSFEVCTNQAFGSVAATTYRTDFIVVGEIN